MQALLLAAGLLFLALGVVLTASAFADYEDVVANEDKITDLPPHEKDVDILLIFLGLFFTIFGFVLLGEYDDAMVTSAILNNYCNLYRIVHKSG